MPSIATTFKKSQITSPPPVPQNKTPECCFVVQDTIDYNYWNREGHSRLSLIICNANGGLDISVSTTTYTVMSTDIRTHVLSYKDTVVTSVETSTSPFTSSELITFDLAAQNTNRAAGPATKSSELGGTATVTYAQTMYISPAWTMTKLT